MKTKFRVWDNEDKKYFEPIYDASNGKLLELSISLSGEITRRTMEGLEHESCFPDRYEIEQFTGLKDENGVDVFDGDILREPVMSKYDENSYVAYEVFFHDNDCCDVHIGWQMNRTHFQGNICGTSHFPRMKPSVTNRMEVIGNIHENPELI